MLRGYIINPQNIEREFVMEFDIPQNELSRLSVNKNRISLSHPNPVELRVLGIQWSRGDYSIFEYSYYSCLKKYGYTPNLSNMVSLHNYIIEGRL